MKRLAIMLLLVVAVTILPNIALATAMIEPLEGSGVSVEYNIPDDFKPYISITESNGIVSYEFNFGQEQWEKIYQMSDGSDGGMFFNITGGAMNIIFPSNAIGATSDAQQGHSDDAEAIDFMNLRLPQLLSSGNFQRDITIKNGLHLAANISYSGTTAIITPYNHTSTRYILWRDDAGQNHYHKTWQTQTHESLTPVRIENAVPNPTNISANRGNASNVAWSIEEPYVLSYFITGSEQTDVVTGIKAPSDNAVSAIVSHNYMNTEEYSLVNGILDYTVKFDGNYRNSSLGIQWLDADGNIVSFQRLRIQYNPISNGVALDELLEPIPSIAFKDVNEISCFSYDNETGCITYVANSQTQESMYGVWLDSYIATTDITIPNGTKYVWSEWNMSSLYSPKNAPSKEWMEAGGGRDINDWHSDYLYSECANMVSKVALPDGQAILVTEKTHSNSIYQSWVLFYDENYKLLETSSGNYGYFVYQTNALASDVAALQTSTPTELVVSPVAICNDAAQGDKLVITDMPNTINAEENTFVLLFDMDYQNSSGNSTYPHGEVTIYLPYPKGMIFEQAQSYNFELFHYKHGLNGEGEPLAAEKTPYGLKIACDSFSPFLLICQKSETGYSVSSSAGVSPILIAPKADSELSVLLDSSVSMAVNAADASSYKWFVDKNDGIGFVPIDNATASQYTIAQALMSHDGYRFYCVVSNEYDSVKSPVFTLHVINELKPPQTGDKPANVNLLVGVLCLVALLACVRRCKKNNTK